jgi:hypothetical protein
MGQERVSPSSVRAHERAGGADLGDALAVHAESLKLPVARGDGVVEPVGDDVVADVPTHPPGHMMSVRVHRLRQERTSPYLMMSKSCVRLDLDRIWSACFLSPDGPWGTSETFAPRTLELFHHRTHLNPALNLLKRSSNSSESSCGETITVQPVDPVTPTAPLPTCPASSRRLLP